MRHTRKCLCHTIILSTSRQLFMPATYTMAGCPNAGTESLLWWWAKIPLQRLGSFFPDLDVRVDLRARISHPCWHCCFAFTCTTLCCSSTAHVHQWTSWRKASLWTTLVRLVFRWASLFLTLVSEEQLWDLLYVKQQVRIFRETKRK